MSTSCSHCRDLHLFNCCHKGLQLIKFMQSEETIQSLNMSELRWLSIFYKYKPSSYKKVMIRKLLSLDIVSRLSECPICYEKMNCDTMVITSCAHAFCDHCILRHIQENDKCPCCREYCPLLYLLLVISKERAVNIYKDIYSTTHILEEVDIIAISEQEDRVRSFEYIRNNISVIIFIGIFIWYIYYKSYERLT